MPDTVRHVRHMRRPRGPTQRALVPKVPDSFPAILRTPSEVVSASNAIVIPTYLDVLKPVGDHATVNRLSFSVKANTFLCKL